MKKMADMPFFAGGLQYINNFKKETPESQVFMWDLKGYHNPFKNGTCTLVISPFPSSTAPYCTVELAIHNSPIQNFIIHLVVRSSRIYNQNIGSIKNNTRCNKVFNKLRYKEVASCKLPYVL